MEVKDLRKLENSSISFTVTEEGAAWQEALERVSATLQKKKPIKGYEAGTAPLKTAYGEYGKPLLEKTVSDIVAAAIGSIYEEHEYYPVSDPDITILRAGLTAMRADVVVFIYPEVPDFDYSFFTVEKPIKTVTEADIDEGIDRYMKSHLWVHEIDREARMGDIVEVSFQGTSEGQPFEYDHSRQVRFRVGSGFLFAGLDEAIIGHVAGDDLDLTLTMPQNFHRRAIAGKTIDLHVHLLSVNVRDLLECTDEFVKEKVSGADTVAEFREKQRARIQKLNDQKTARAFEDNFQEKVASFVTCQIPESMIDAAVSGFVEALRQESFQRGTSMNKLLEDEGKTMDDFKREVYPVAVRQVKVSMALDYIARKEQFEVTEEAVEERVNTYMKQAKSPSYESALKKLGGEESVREKIMNDMAADVLRSHCRVVEVEVV